MRLKWIRSLKKHPLAALTIGLLVGAVLSSVRVEADIDASAVSDYVELDPTVSR
jgi:hypothetical protein